MVGAFFAVSIRRRFKDYTVFVFGRAIARTLRTEFGVNAGIFRGTLALFRFAKEYAEYRRMNKGAGYELEIRRLFPCLTDRTPETPIEPTYFIQDAWFARKIAMSRPSHHVDVASSAKSVALVAQFVPTTFIDIRAVNINVPNFSYVYGSVLEMPYEDESLLSVSSLCVIEHIGLGRYGDPLDAFGTEKAAKELTRVLRRGGDLYVSVPVDSNSCVYFNAHRAFTREHVMRLFSTLQLKEESYIYVRENYDKYEPERGFGTGLYHFRRE